MATDKTVTVTVPSVVTNDTLTSYNNYSNQDGLLNNMTPAEASTGKTISLTDGLIHEVTSKPVGAINGEFSNVISNQVQVDLSIAPLVFTLEEMVKNSETDYQITGGGSYPTSFGVSDAVVLSGDFEYKTAVADVDTIGMMMGISTNGTNREWDNIALPWEYGVQIANNGDIKDITAGVLTDTLVDATNTSGDEMRLVRVGSNLKLYYNLTEIHDFGTISTANMYVHISQASASGGHVRTPQVS